MTEKKGEHRARPAEEIEWQFDTPDLDAVDRRIEFGPILENFEVGRPSDLRFFDIYLDTSKLALLRSGLACRVRVGSVPEAARDAVLTLKSLHPAHEGVTRRTEIDQPIESALPRDAEGRPLLSDLSRIVKTGLTKDGPVTARLDGLLGPRPLEVLFILRQSRRAREVRRGDALLGELVLDRAEALGSTYAPAQEMVERVELELKADQGRLSKLEDFARALATACDLTPAKRAKFRAGLLSSGRDLERLLHCGPIETTLEPTTHELAYRALRVQCERLRAREAPTRLGEEPEALHQMRVAVRRLRAGLSFFREVLPEASERHRARLRALGRALGPVRDLDVLSQEMARAASAARKCGVEEATGLEALRVVLERRRAEARARLVRRLDAPGHARDLERLTSFLRRGAPRRGIPIRPAREELPTWIGRRRRRLRRLLGSLEADGPTAALHEARIAAKKLRYALEFSQPLYEPESARYVRRLVDLQDLLGTVQDLAVGQSILLGLRVPRDPEERARLLRAEGCMLERARRAASRARRRMGRLLQRLRGGTWRRLKARLQPEQAEGER
ncbi:MAG: CHAD domain-containing protein [Candidatus Eisenbacteria bacterium]